MSDFVLWAVVAAVVGWAISVGWPFLRKYLNGEVERFEWRKVALRLIFGAGAVFATFASAEGLAKMEEFAAQGWPGVGLAVLYGLFTIGASSFGHQLQSSPKAVKAWKNKA